MSSQKFAIPFRVHLKRSFILSALLLFLYGGALAFTALLSWPWWVKLGLSLLLIVSFVRVSRRHLLCRGRGAVLSMICEDGERWRLECAAGGWVGATLLSGSSLQPWVALMSFRVEGERRPWSVVVMSDSTDSTTFRRLHARLRRTMPAPL